MKTSKRVTIFFPDGTENFRVETDEAPKLGQEADVDGIIMIATAVNSNFCRSIQAGFNSIGVPLVEIRGWDNVKELYVGMPYKLKERPEPQELVTL